MLFGLWSLSPWASAEGTLSVLLVVCFVLFFCFNYRNLSSAFLFWRPEQQPKKGSIRLALPGSKERAQLQDPDLSIGNCLTLGLLILSFHQSETIVWPSYWGSFI